MLFSNEDLKKDKIVIKTSMKEDDNFWVVKFFVHFNLDDLFLTSTLNKWNEWDVIRKTFILYRCTLTPQKSLPIQSSPCEGTSSLASRGNFEQVLYRFSHAIIFWKYHWLVYFCLKL